MQNYNFFRYENPLFSTLVFAPGLIFISLITSYFSILFHELKILSKKTSTAIVGNARAAHRKKRCRDNIWFTASPAWHWQ